MRTIFHSTAVRMSFVTVIGDANRTFVFDSTRLEAMDVISYSITLALAVLSNTCLLVLESKIWLKHRRLSQPRLLIILLALVDTISCIFGILPRLIISSLTPCLVSQIYMLTRFTLGCFGILSKLTVVLMGVERFISIRAPFFYVRNCTIKSFVVVHIILVMYSLLLGSVSIFLDYYLFESSTKLIQNIEAIKCQTIFLIFEFEIYPRKTTGTSITQWQYMSATSAFTIFKLMQDFTLILILLICNTSVISGLRDMEKRLQVSCPRSTSDQSNAAQDLMTATGKEFSRLMIAINIIVLLLITPEMVCIL